MRHLLNAHRFLIPLTAPGQPGANTNRRKCGKPTGTTTMSTETAKTEGTEYKPTHAVRTAANMTGYYGTGTCYESAMEAMLDAMGDQSHYAKPENFTFFNVTGKVYSNGDIEGDRISMNDKEKKEISNIWEIMFLGVAVDHCEQLLQILKTKQGYDKHLSEIERMLNDLDAAREKLGY